MAAYTRNYFNPGSTIQQEGSFLYEWFLERESQYESIPNLSFYQAESRIDPEIKSQLNEIIENLKEHSDNFRNGSKRRRNKRKAAIVAQELSQYENPSLSTFKQVTEKHCQDEQEEASNVDYYVEWFFFLMDMVMSALPGTNIIRLSYDYVKNVICPLVEKHGGWGKVFSKVESWIDEHQVETALIAGGAILGLGYLLGKAIVGATESAGSNSKRRTSDKYT